MRALFVTQDPDLTRLLGTLAATEAGPVTVVDSVEAATAEARQGGFRLVVFDPRLVSDLGDARLDEILAQLEGAQAALLGDARMGGPVLSFLRHGRSTHVIGCPVGESGAPMPDDSTIGATMAKIALTAASGVSEYLAPGTDLIVRSIGSYDAKAQAVRDIGAYAEEKGCKRQQIARVEAVTDELLLNGLYDAPALRMGKRLLGEAAPEALSDVHPVTLRYGCDGPSFVVGVQDLYGELTRENLLDHLELAASGRRSPRPIGESATGGAGLGLHLVLDAVTHLVAKVTPKRETEVIGIFDLSRSNRRQRGASPSLSLLFGAREA